ncbi:MAG: tRNA threonylcarbamoyladenosine biosynthesis protein TsaE [Gammaproteobacteria bacterium]|jgi:tRNA threonylcarbamoyladenosine biosynthesis protein TsaE|nr:tRNA threonylcarbamoyladenosine biosynthesis protein TsaE [Gammaproteobacteria bacterium]
MHWFAKTADDTEAFGARLAVARPAGNAFATIHLAGDLGAGKTTLARGFLRACGVSGPVRSPTYTLVEVYETPTVSVVHLDLYRLVDPAEMEPLGLREFALPGYLWLIEWPDRGSGRLPFPDLSVTLCGGPNGHEINVTGTSALGETWVSLVENRAPGT